MKTTGKPSGPSPALDWIGPLSLSGSCTGTRGCFQGTGWGRLTTISLRKRVTPSACVGGLAGLRGKQPPGGAVCLRTRGTHTSGWANRASSVLASKYCPPPHPRPRPCQVGRSRSSRAFPEALHAHHLCEDICSVNTVPSV